MNQTVYNEYFKQMKENIQNYKKNVIDQKYTNDLEELQSLLDNLRRLTDEYFKDNQRNFTEEVKKQIDSEVKEAIDYINLIASETAEFIRKDQSLPGITADVLLSQNAYIKNLSLRDEITRQMNYYEKASLKVRMDYQKHKTEKEFLERFVVLENAEGRRKYIVKECADAYQKLVSMKQNLNLVLRRDLKNLQKLYNRSLKELPPKEMGEIKALDVDPSLRLLSDDEVRVRAQEILKYIHALDNFPGMKESYHFTFEGHDYHVVIPVGKKAAFESKLQELAGLRDVLKERENANQRSFSTEVGASEDYIDIAIDHSMFDSMTVQQKTSYLQSLMLRIESQKNSQLITVLDANQNEKKIPAYYYRIYMECLGLLEVLSMTIDHRYADSLSDDDKIRYYCSVMEKIKSSTKEPFVFVNGEKISAQYYQSYFEAKKAYDRLVSSRQISTSAKEPIAIEDKLVKNEYMIDEEYVKGLPEKLQLSYYANLIGKIATSNMQPVVVYESFGVKLNVPISLVTTVQECERRALELKELLALQIDQEKVNAKTPEMQFGYYTNLIERMRHSKKGPKIRVEAFGESFEIPYECLDSFQECLNQIERLKSTFELANKTYIKVEKVKKPMTTKVKEYFKNLSTRVKVALGIAGLTAAALTGFSIGKAQTIKDVQPSYEATDDLITRDFSTPDSDVSISQIPKSPINHSTSSDDARIDGWVKNANQTLASRLGGTMLLNNEALYSSYDSTKPLKMNQGIQNSKATIVLVSIKMADGTLHPVNYTEQDAQTRINELISQGGVVTRVGIVSEPGELDFKQNGYITGFVNIDENSDLTHGGVTNLSKEIQDLLSQGRSL